MKTPSSGAHPAWRKPGSCAGGPAWTGRRSHRDVPGRRPPGQPDLPQQQQHAAHRDQVLRLADTESLSGDHVGDGGARQSQRGDNLTGHARVFTIQAGGDGHPDALTIHASVVPARRPDSSLKSQELPGPRPPLS
jgi:hypothetical protein